MEAKNAISENVMEREMFTIDFASEFADKRMDIYRYFEGVVGDNEFNINRKTYRRGWSNLGSFNFAAKIHGDIIEMKNGVEITVGFKGPNLAIIIVFMLLSFLFIFIVKKTTATPILISLPTLAIYWSIYLIIQRIIYNNRIQKDYEQLKMIFKTDGE